MTGERVVRLAFWAVIVHTGLLVALSYAESSAFVQNGWNDSVILLAFFLLFPVASVVLIRTGRVRAGSILLLGIMPAAVYIHAQTLIQLIGSDSVLPEMTVSYGTYLSLVVAILVTSVLGSVLSWTLLRTDHASSGAPGPEVTS